MAHSYQSEPVMRAYDLSLKYGSKAAFENVNLPIHRGKITALVGPSGCGKTSFLMCLNRLVEMIPSAEVSGRVTLDQTELLDKNFCGVRLRKRVGMIFQKPSPFPLSIRRNIHLPLIEHGTKNRQALEQKTEAVLRQVALWDEVKDRMDKSALALSGGQQQRLCMARALALEPEIILMDEPCSALDPISGGIVEDLIRELKRQYTVVIVTHNLAQAKRIADYVAFFWVRDGAGTLVEFGPTKEIFEQPQDPRTHMYVSGIRG